MGDAFVVSFMPARQCAYCETLTTLGIAAQGYAEFSVLPLCVEHGYVAPSIGGIHGEEESIERFVVWFYQQRGRATVIGPCEVQDIDEWTREHPQAPGSVGLQLKAWQVRHQDKDSVHMCYVVWNAEKHILEYYEANKPKKEEPKAMSTPQERMNLFNQYRQVYGELATAGKYNVGDRVRFDGGQVGEVIWKYDSANGLMYVLDDNTGFPTEERSQDIEGKVL